MITHRYDIAQQSRQRLVVVNDDDTRFWHLSYIRIPAISAKKIAISGERERERERETDAERRQKMYGNMEIRTWSLVHT